MAFDFLVPVATTVLAHCELLPPEALGRHIQKHSEKEGIPPLAVAGMAILGVRESRNAYGKKTQKLDTTAIRLALYGLMKGNWDTIIADMGDIEEGDAVEDTYFVVKQIVAGLLEENVIPIVIGATQDITYPCYRAFDGIQDMINLVAVDSRFDFGANEEMVSSESYMSKIITDKPNNLYNFSNLGYQSYFNAQEEMDLMERLFFDAYRLGEVANDLEMAEPVLRNAQLVSVDARAVRAAEMGMDPGFSPNGFTGREICAISRYAGKSEDLRAFGVFEMPNNPQAAQMTAQLIWYFIEGVNFRINESPRANKNSFTRYSVLAEDHTLVFYKSDRSQRWWIEVPASQGQSAPPPLLPCTEKDYRDACAQIVPDRWLKAYKKGLY